MTKPIFVNSFIINIVVINNENKIHLVTRDKDGDCACSESNSDMNDGHL